MKHYNRTLAKSGLQCFKWTGSYFKTFLCKQEEHQKFSFHLPQSKSGIS